jgi:uncharacterized protein DUF6660
LKKLAIILGLYIFALTVIPCTDDAVHHDDLAVKTELSVETPHYELCSPFCSDHDCHTHITVSFVNSTFVQQQFSDLAIVERPIAIPTPFFAIWQPPKIG